MNIKVDLEITPEEVRRLMGLPDYQAFQEELMNKLRQQMEAGVEGYDPQSLLRPFMNNAFASMDAFQKLFGGMMGMAAQSGDKK